MNLFLDRSIERRRGEFETLREKHGLCRADTPIEAENALRGKWMLNCERGQVKVTVTLAPTLPPTVQYLETSSILPPGPGFSLMAAAIERSLNQREALAESLLSLGAPADVEAQLEAARAWGICRAGGLTSGGPESGVMRFTCARGDLDVRLTVDSAGLLTALRIAPASGEVCVP
jgi:hypothetical protein